MMLVKLQHSNLAEHQASIFKQMYRFRKEGQLCDTVLKSRDGTEHGAHKAILCAASEDLRNMLVGPFREADQVQQGQPVEMAASDAVVFALLEYVYGEEPQVELEDSFELLRLADAYNFSHLAATVQASLRSCLDSASLATALKVLQHTKGLHDLQDACEDKVTANFEMCIDMVDFLELSAGQLGRILRRADLSVSREEVVVKGLFNWFNGSKDRVVQLGLLLQNVDFRSLSSSNLGRLMGPVGYDLQREVAEALQAQKKRSAANTADAFQPKRWCLQLWSPDLGASAEKARRVFPHAEFMCWHDGAIYYATYDRENPSRILRWKPGDAAGQVIAGRGARVNGVNDLSFACKVSVCPDGKIFVADLVDHRLPSFENGSGNVVLSDVTVRSVFCSPSGAVYLVTHFGTAVQKLVGTALQPMISSDNLPAELRFDAFNFFVTKDEVIYLSDRRNGRILRLNPGEAEPVVLGESPNEENSDLYGLFVTEEEKVYVADRGQQKVWSFHPGDATWTEVLRCPGELKPEGVLVQGGSLYVSMSNRDYPAGSGTYEYLLPPKLQLE